MIPDLRDGRLPPGVHSADIGELRDKLGWGRKRRSLIDGLEIMLGLMEDCGIKRVYVDGSFVTDKDRPNDIDGCYDIPPGATDASLRPMYPIWPWNPANRAMSKTMFGIELAPSGFPATAAGQPYLEFFQRNREGNQRGVVLIELGR